MPSSPRDVALEMLSRLFPVAPGDRAPDGRSFSLAAFQREAVGRVRRVLARRGGAVLADSVGLGKTFVALALIEETVQSGGDVVVIVPAALRGMWRSSLGRLDGAGGWHLVSHTQLARGVRVRLAPRLIVVDEAHRFRNPRTLRYRALAALVHRECRVLLITATPVNNRPADLLHLVRLFARDDAFRDVGVPSLVGAFGTASAGSQRASRTETIPGAEPDDARIAAVVRAVVVRRTRAMIDARFGSGEAAGVLRFPGRGPPRIVRFEDPDLPRRVAGVAGLELPAYQLGSFTSGSSCGGPPASSSAAPRASSSGSGRGSAAALIRLGLLKRLDSSPAAFRSTLARLAQATRAALDAAEVGRVLAPARGAAGGHPGDLDPHQLTLVELVASAAPPDLDLDALVAALHRDLDRLRAMEVDRDSRRSGGKLDALNRLLDDLAGEKVLLFTEYRDTAESLWRDLAGRGRVGRVDGGGAWLGGRRAGRRAVIERFAPRANGRPCPPDRERVEVLIATDVLAEGLNLQDARHVVSYDLPWNPVRLLQRIGRIDRLGSDHDEVEVHLFVPDTGLEPLLGLVRRLRRKLGDIAAVVGAEHADDLLDSLLRRPPAAAARARAPVEPRAGVPDGADDPLERLRTLWHQERGPRHPIAGGGPGEIGDPQATPATHATAAATGSGAATATLTVSPEHPAASLRGVLLVQGASDVELLEIDATGSLWPAGAGAVAALERALACEACGGGPDRAPPGPLPLERVRDYLRTRAALAATPAALSPRDPGARLARRLRRGMAALGSAAPPALIARADAVLQQLALPLGPAAERAVHALLERGEDQDVTGLIREVEGVLGRAFPTGSPGIRDAAEAPRAASAAARSTRVLAALRIRVDPHPSAG